MPPLRTWPPVNAEDTHDLLILLAEVKLGGRKQPLDVPLDPVGDEAALPSGPISRTSGISPWSMPFGNSMQTLCPSSKRGRQGGVSLSTR
jgi:hypothetical protein